MKVQTATCLAAMLLFTRQHRPDIRLRVLTDGGTLIQCVRTQLVRHSMEVGATHILWLDADMTFPPDTLLRLLEHNKPIVGANYTTRRPPFEPTAKSLETQAFSYVDHLSTGLEAAYAIALGCALTDVAVFSALPEPWFDVAAGYDRDDGTRQYAMGEDYWFCLLAQAELDVHPWIDHDLSKLVGHIGERVVTFEDALNDRPQMRVIRGHRMERPDPVLPHVQFQDVADLHMKVPAEDLKAQRAEYDATLATSEEEREAEWRALYGVGDG